MNKPDGPAGRWGILALIMAAQTMANVGPLGIPSIAPLIRDDLGLSMAQAGSFLSAYYIGPVLMSLPAGWMADHWGTFIFAGMQTVWLSFLVLYLDRVIHVPLIQAGRYLVLTQVTGMAGRIVFGILSDRAFGGRRRIVLVIAGVGSTVCSLVMAATGPGTGVWVLAPLALCFGFFGIGWNGVQYTLMAELVGPRAAGTAVGLGLAISSFGVTLCPPLFGLAVEQLGSFAMPWAGLGLIMAATLCLLIPVREGRMETP